MYVCEYINKKNVNLSSWIRTSDLKDYKHITVPRSDHWAIESRFYVAWQKEVLPGFEPGLLDSKSRVITNYTIEPQLVYIILRTQKIIYVISPTGFEPAILRFVVSRLIRWATGTHLFILITCMNSVYTLKKVSTSWGLSGEIMCDIVWDLNCPL